MKQEIFQYSVLGGIGVLIILLILNALMLSHGGKSYDRGGKNMHEMMMQKEGEKMWGEKDEDTAMKMHCQEMPDMKGCEKYMSDTETMDHSTMDMSAHDPMQMSMADMGNMLEGKTGDELDRAFLEGMIPHHQGAIDMARYLEQSARPELQELGRNIITAQQAEIEQMQKWLKEWNLAGTGALETQTPELTQ